MVHGFCPQAAVLSSYPSSFSTEGVEGVLEREARKKDDFINSAKSQKQNGRENRKEIGPGDAPKMMT